MIKISTPKLPKRLQPRKRKNIIKSITDLFNEYIRKRDLDHEGWVRCCTCDKPLHIKGGDINAGHFMIAKRLATRWNEKNCHAQCIDDNMTGGEQYRHSQYIDKRYGKGTAKDLEQLSLSVIKYSDFDLIELEAHWKKKLAELKGVE